MLSVNATITFAGASTLLTYMYVCLSVCWLKDGVELVEKCRVVQSGRGRGVLVCAPDSMVLCDCELVVVTCM